MLSSVSEGRYYKFKVLTGSKWLCSQGPVEMAIISKERKDDIENCLCDKRRIESRP